MATDLEELVKQFGGTVSGTAPAPAPAPAAAPVAAPAAMAAPAMAPAPAPMAATRVARPAPAAVAAAPAPMAAPAPAAPAPAATDMTALAAEFGGRPEMGFFGSIVESVTGRARATPETQRLPEWTAMPELNQMSMASFKSALGTLLTNPQETVQILQSNFPGMQVRQDARGNFILRSSVDQKEYAIPPGFSAGDIPRALGGLFAFTPAGRAATIPGAVVAAGVTQAGIEATQAGAGGRFDTGEVALAGALGGAGQAVTRIPQAVRDVRAGRVPPAAAPPTAPAGAPGAAPVAPVAGRIEPTFEPAPMMPAGVQPSGAVTFPVPPSPAAPAAPAVAMTAEELTATTRRATEGGLGAGRATEILATQAAPDPKVLEAARRLKIEGYLQPDHLTSNQAYRELAQAVKSIPGSQARAAEIAGLEQVGKQADDLITKIGGLTDLSQMNQVVRTQLGQTVKNLKDQADDAYTQLRTDIPAKTRGPADNVLNFVRQRADELGDPDYLSALEKDILRKLTPKNIKDDTGKVIGKSQPTYTLIDDVRKDAGAASRQQGPFADADTGLAKKLYDLIDDDQFNLAETVGRGEQYRLAKSLVKMRKGFEDDMVSLFGKQLDQSLVTKLSTATTALSKGDGEKLVNILTAIPKDMRQMVAASALNTAFGKATQNGTLNFNTYANWYKGLLENKQAYAALMNNLPQPARKSLSDLYRVADNVRKASRERITTGRIQAVQQELQGADSLLGSVYMVAKRAAIGLPIEAATTAVGLPGAGIASGLTAALSKGVKPQVIKAADELISSPEFQRLAIEGANKTPSQATVRAVARSAAFQRFAEAAKMPREMSWRERWIVQSMQAGRQSTQENE